MAGSSRTGRRRVQASSRSSTTVLHDFAQRASLVRGNEPNHGQQRELRILLVCNCRLKCLHSVSTAVLLRELPGRNSVSAGSSSSGKNGGEWRGGEKQRRAQACSRRTGHSGPNSCVCASSSSSGDGDRDVSNCSDGDHFSVFWSKMMGRAKTSRWLQALAGRQDRSERRRGLAERACSKGTRK